MLGDDAYATYAAALREARPRSHQDCARVFQWHRSCELRGGGAQSLLRNSLGLMGASRGAARLARKA